MINDVKSYYALKLPLTEASAIAGRQPVSDCDWLSGNKIDHPFGRPLIFRFSPGTMHHYYPLEIPLMHDEFLKVLKDLGFENIESFPAVIAVDGSDELFCSYKAVNILGKIKVFINEEEAIATELAFPKITPSVEIDEDDRKGLLIFRIEGRDDIVVCESLKQVLEQKFDDLAFEIL